MDIKKVFLFFAILIIAAGCTSTPVAINPTEDANIHPATSTPVEVYKFTIAAGAGWYVEGNGLSVEINEQIPTVFSDVKETESLMENVDLLTSGKAGLAFVYDYHVALANQGKLMSAFPDAPTEKIAIKCGTEMIRPMFPDYAEAARIILPLYEEQLHIIVSETSGITTINDLKGRHIFAGIAGSVTEQQARFIINSLNMDWENEIVREPFDLPTAILALKNGELDALFWSGYSPNTELSELLNESGTEFNLIPIAGDEAEKLIQVNPGIFHKSSIPAGTYLSNQEAIDTLATTVVLAAMEDFPEEYVPLILATFFEPASADWKSRMSSTPEASINLLKAELRSYLHPGAVRYFTEIGVLQ